MDTGFGWIKIRGTTYEHDIIIHTDGSITKRKKKLSKGLKENYGHTPLSEIELEFLAGEKPEVIYIGTGQSGSLPLTTEAKKLLSHYTIVMKPTPALLEELTDEKGHFVAIIHVTC